MDSTSWLQFYFTGILVVGLSINLGGVIGLAINRAVSTKIDVIIGFPELSLK